jgi:Ca2+-binding EF-hand superfamily protein
VRVYESHACRYTNHYTLRQAMIDEFDLDGDGEINEQEFLSIMTDEA